MQTDAIVFVLSERLMPNAHICYQYCLTHGYRAVGIVKDDWVEAMQYIKDGTASVIVVATEADLQIARSMRIEIASHHNKPSGKNERNVRTSRINRRDAAT